MELDRLNSVLSVNAKSPARLTTAHLNPTSTNAKELEELKAKIAKADNNLRALQKEKHVIDRQKMELERARVKR